MPSLQKIKWLFPAMVIFLCANLVFAQENDSFDEDSPEVTARVARISFIRGDAQVRRAGETDWENASLNLPLVEGDEIATSPDSRVEIQFDSQNFLRLAESSVLKVTTLRDDGIAVSLSEGLLSLRVFSFEKEKGYFEIDSPQTTVSVQRAGLFKIDARQSEQVRISVTEDGEARIYSDTSGFTMRSGRSATVYLSGDRLGEWETSALYSEEWDDWVAERDNKLANLLGDSYYDKYYDRDIYGAEDLNDYGSWSDSDDYGKVWRPNYTSVSVYNNWSPYRYGHWRWVNPYGWVWINDEPWGWATYHYGRWIHDNRGWGWTPYSYHRPKRSWWRPALVAIFNVNQNVCWYPLSHRDRYRDYNRNYRRSDRNFGGRRDDYGTFGSINYQRLPENSITAVRSDEFGRRRNAARPISNQIVRQTLANNTVAVAELPKFEERRREFRRETNFNRVRQAEQVRTGVAERRSGVELDRQLRNERFRNNRREERIRKSDDGTRNLPQNSTVNNDSRRNERFERQNRNENSQPSNQPNRRIVVPPTGTVNNQTGTDSETERRNRERRQQRNDEQRPINVSPNNDSNEEVQRPRNNQRNGDENRVIVRVPDNNSMENNRREQRRNENSENNNRSEERRRNQENNGQNNIRRDNPPDGRPTYYPRNNEGNRSVETPRTENTQPREQPRREERREEMRREEPRREQPRPETPRVETRREEPRVERREAPRQEPPRQEQPRREERREQPRQEQPRQEQPRYERREEPRREAPRQEQPRQEPPRQREQPREERRSVPKTERKPEQPIDN